ncbi:HIT domain-containing protein [Wenzhouxiangella sp. XN79A]|uniref:HIT domain-containing protein n=1 Tax=Wenzhouxiangella sp. XN79A TaxID=2724193 RepID=UPI00144AD170|nr:HIT family protein [Wenzhouxiangella sp. XN79A]NKI34503.1 HIT domain-containing protein [Wenzhouxiangella sp. XN79A]
MSAFEIDPRLAADSLPVIELDLCEVRLINDARYPWLILVPRRAGLVELIDLSADDRARLAEEVDRCARVLKSRTGADKMNVAALGNQVPMLHVHVIARFRGDDAWPGPVWGVLPASPYSDRARTLRAELAEALRT